MTKKQLKIFLCIVIVMLGSITALVFQESQVRILAREQECVQAKEITKVLIQKDDTLWSIAKAYDSHEYSSVREHIREIKQCNNLTSDTIYEGEYLIVPYYPESISLCER